MSVNIDRTTSVELPDDINAIADGLLTRVMQLADGGREADVDLLICDSGEIRVLNRDFRDIDRETDVLSFPNLAFETPGVLQELSDHGDLDPETGNLLLGSIALNAERAVSQAKEYGHSVKRECAFLIAHSLLHLVGYDHETEQDAAEMEQLQEDLLCGMGITRDIKD